MTLKRCAFPVMERLSKTTMETIILAGWVNSTPCCIERINSPQPLKLSVDIGSWFHYTLEVLVKLYSPSFPMRKERKNNRKDRVNQVYGKYHYGNF